jgi:hypothetical protein
MGVPDHTDDRLSSHFSFQSPAFKHRIMPAASGRINMLRAASHISLLCTSINAGLIQYRDWLEAPYTWFPNAPILSPLAAHSRNRG